MRNIENGILKALGGAIENDKEIDQNLLKKMKNEGLLLAGPSAANVIFGTPEKKTTNKLLLIRILEKNEEMKKIKSTFFKGKEITAQIYAKEDYGDHEVIPIKIHRGELKDLPQIFSLNFQQVIIDFKEFKIFYSLPFLDFYEDKQIKIINVNEPQVFLRKLKELNQYSSIGHINIHLERKIALLYLFFVHGKKFSGNTLLKNELTLAIQELSKKVNVQYFLKNKKICSQTIVFLLRVALESSSKKTQRIFSFLNRGRHSAIPGWCSNSVRSMNILFAKDPSEKKIKEIENLLYLPTVRQLATIYVNNDQGLIALTDDLTILFKKSFKDLTIAKHAIDDFITKFPNDTLEKIKDPDVWNELNQTIELESPIFPEGVTVKLLKSENDLIFEGKRMKHCLGKIRKFSDIEERQFFSLYYKGEYSTVEIQRNVKGSTTESNPEDLLGEFERMLGGDPRGPQQSTGFTKRTEDGYLRDIEPEAYYVFSNRGKCNKVPSIAHKQIAESLCKYLDQKKSQPKKEIKK